MGGDEFEAPPTRSGYISILHYNKSPLLLDDSKIENSDNEGENGRRYFYVFTKQLLDDTEKVYKKRATNIRYLPHLYFVSEGTQSKDCVGGSRVRTKTEEE